MENINEEMQEFLVEEPFAFEDVLPSDCKKEAIEFGAEPNEIIFV